MISVFVYVHLSINIIMIVKCKELSWLCVPRVAETYGAWGNKAIEALSQLASRLATLTSRPKVDHPWRPLWQAQSLSSEGQCHCHTHQMCLALPIGSLSL